MQIYKGIVKPMLFKLDPEFVHDRFVLAGRIAGSNPITRGVLKRHYRYEDHTLEQDICGVHFPNPVGLAAGFDKDCKLMKIMPAMGFGFEEVGSITADPYKGNPGPRLVRLPKDESIIVYYGLKNKGAVKLRKRLLQRDGKARAFEIPIGISIAKTNKDFATLDEKIDDWIAGLQLLKDCGSYITLNVSCPNTFDQSNFNDPLLLSALFKRVDRAQLNIAKPVFLKLSADITVEQLDRIIEVCDQHSCIKGFIFSNLVKDRSKLQLKSERAAYEQYKGGLSGKVVTPYALALVQHAYTKAGNRYVIIGCGGIFTAEDAYEYIKSGASLVQLVTGMIYNGPAAISDINRGLVKLLQRDGYTSIAQAVGVSCKN